MNRIRIGRGIKGMYCPSCKAVAEATQDADSDLIRLSCGHTRNPGLPKTDGSVGVEDIFKPEGLRLFPVIKDRVDSLGTGFEQGNYWGRRR